MDNYDKKRKILLIESTIGILKISSEFAEVDISSIINDWKDILEELKEDSE